MLKAYYVRIMFFVIFLSFQHLDAQVRLPAIFSDNMVLQQLSDVPVWGESVANTKITVVTSWDKQKYTAISDNSGKWIVKIKTPQAGGPFEMTISDQKTTKLNNVMIGEVWLCSGQSNMEMPMSGWGKIQNYESEIEKAKYPNIRLLQVEKSACMVPSPEMKVTGGSWQICSPSTIEEFSATAYFFGKNLYEHLNVPIGLIHASWGGTLAEAWTSAESLEMMPDFSESIKTIRQIPQNVSERKKMFEKKKTEWEQLVQMKDFGYTDDIPVASSLDYGDSAWMSMKIPQNWEDESLPDFDGFVWFRRIVDIPSQWKNKDLILNLGTIDDNDITFFNGTEIGRSEGWDRNRCYRIPKEMVTGGTAVITVRVTDTGGGGGIYGNADDLYIGLLDKKNKISLSGEWKYKVALRYSDAPFSKLMSDDANNPSALFNGMINPIIPYKIKGVIWYQGEANENKPDQYRDLFPLLINDWRQKWGYSFPFYFVQLANYKLRNSVPEESNWAELRDAQKLALHLNDTGMAVSIDIGDANDVHPKNKQDVGKRLSLIARANTYNEPIEYTGPVYHSYTIEGNTCRVLFAHTSGGLVTPSNEKLTGFSIAGPDHKFYWGDAKIEGDEVVVSSPYVIFPCAVRYGWANNPECNLYNGAGLPASPFRTNY
ncbi:MAG: sialate O-acetylesterase [Dysgonomonas sp.]